MPNGVKCAKVGAKSGKYKKLLTKMAKEYKIF